MLIKEEIMQEKDAQILIVEDEEDQRIRLKYVLESEGYRISEADSGDKAVEMLGKTGESYNIVITDLKMPGKNNGEDVLRETKKLYPNTEVLIITAYGSIDSAVRSMINGAFDYIQKPLNIPELRIKIERALKCREHMDDLDAKNILKNNMEALSKEIDEYKEIISEIHKDSEKLKNKFQKDDPEYNTIEKISKESEIK